MHAFTWMILLLLASAVSAALPDGWARTLERAAPLPAFVDRKNIFAADEVPWQELDANTRRKVVFSRRATLVVLEVRRSGKGHDLNHWHHHDQITHVLEGTVEAVVGREARAIEAGGFYACDSNVPHSLRILSDRVKIVEAFTPAREDFRAAPWVGSPPSSRARDPLLPNELREFAYGWFALFDRNAPVDELLARLSGRLEMRFPDATVKSHADFRRWYANVLATIRTAAHEVSDFRATATAGHAVLEMDVRWRATTIAGRQLDFTVHQRWIVDRTDTGLAIRSCTVTPRAAGRR